MVKLKMCGINEIPFYEYLANQIIQQVGDNFYERGLFYDHFSVTSQSPIFSKCLVHLIIRE